jgi:hypothetical protein
VRVLHLSRRACRKCSSASFESGRRICSAEGSAFWQVVGREWYPRFIRCRQELPRDNSPCHPTKG